MCGYDEKIITRLLIEKGVKISISEENCYAHPLVVALDFAVFKQKTVTVEELALLHRKLIRPIPFWNDWSLNVYHHHRIYKLKYRYELMGYVWNYSSTSDSYFPQSFGKKRVKK